MTDLLNSCIGGVVPPVATPLTTDGTVDVESLLRLRQHLLDGGVAGVFGLGSTGEGAYLDEASARTVVRDLSRAKEGEALLVGVVDTSSARVLTLLDRLLEVADGGAVDGVVVTAPFYAATSETEVRRHFELVAKRSPVPVLAYNIPGNVGYALSPQTLSTLIHDGTVVGVKDSSPDLAGLRRLAVAVSDVPSALVFTGSDALLDCALSVGANGAVAGLSNVVPGVFVEAVAAHRAGDSARLATLQATIGTLVNLYTPSDAAQGRNASEVGAIKTTLKLLGVIATDTLPDPLSATGPERTEQIRGVLRDAGLLS